jgi:hypothetical protein
MEIVAGVVVVVGLVGVVLGVVAVRRLRAELDALEAQALAVASRIEALPPDLSRAFGNRDRHVISVELLNLFDLAHRETWLARPLIVLTPRVLSHAIHRRLVVKVRENLAASGVEADVRLHRAR